MRGGKKVHKIVYAFRIKDNKLSILSWNRIGRKVHTHSNIILSGTIPNNKGEANKVGNNDYNKNMSN